jgi:hypothetical protein
LAGEVLEDQLFGEEPGDVAKFQRARARAIDEVPVTVVDDDYVLNGVLAGAPQFAGRPLKGEPGRPCLVEAGSPVSSNSCSVTVTIASAVHTTSP